MERGPLEFADLIGVEIGRWEVRRARHEAGLPRATMRDAGVHLETGSHGGRARPLPRPPLIRTATCARVVQGAAPPVGKRSVPRYGLS